MTMYKNMADYYEHIFPVGKKAEFLKEKFMGRKSLLDIGCSDGRVAEALARAGFKLEAIDLSEEMIRVAKEISEEGVSFNAQVMDMTEVDKHFQEKSFDGIYCIGNTIVHLDSYKAIEKTVKGFKSLLKKNGKLIIQILNYDFIYNKNKTELPIIENGKIKFVRNYKLEEGNIVFNTELLIKETGENFKGSVNLFPIRKSELEEALKSAGFNSFTYYGGFDGKEFNNESMPLIVVAETLREELPSIHC